MSILFIKGFVFSYKKVVLLVLIKRNHILDAGTFFLHYKTNLGYINVAKHLTQAIQYNLINKFKHIDLFELIFFAECFPQQWKVDSLVVRNCRIRESHVRIHQLQLMLVRASQLHLVYLQKVVDFKYQVHIHQLLQVRFDFIHRNC